MGALKIFILILAILSTTQSCSKFYRKEQGAKYNNTKILCVHILHPNGDIIPCFHLVHPNGDQTNEVRNLNSGAYSNMPQNNPQYIPIIKPCIHKQHVEHKQVCQHFIHPKGD